MAVRSIDPSVGTWLVGSLSIFSVYISSYVYLLSKKIEGWKRAEGIIKRCHVVNSPSGVNKNLKVEYRFKTEAGNFEVGNKVSVLNYAMGSLATYSDSDIARVVSMYRNKKARIYYDPAKSRSVLIKKTYHSQCLLFFVTGCFGIAMASMLFYSIDNENMKYITLFSTLITSLVLVMSNFSSK